mmetsp:Transcript_9621/g.16770  ORF Transcript_9621/g.16770 Transcript_9621/m.16770 type:complete len:434 (-) Transcript_9621:589-1890(-)|eukprot:CAMPEP_0184981998 /NCGR_PEP_ID=MMETSP1098-20130426/11574_1 /TAXON_ID=89044 /ORGANISM="Spumella elongata, Strain CCAP 955/1" /LENGTH=433 /DNA_ID=CAMNT_0027505641 /DNA_START=1164 /DNA_END=2465 /DNA_ORIENTATION=-
MEMKANDDDGCNATKRQRIEAAQLFDSKHSFEHRDIVFSPQYPARSFRLMEVPNELVKAVEKGEELSIVGDCAAEAVLCSGSKTYGMKRVETSNCVFFVPPSASGEFSICSSASDYYELQLIVPKLDTLAKLVEPSLYPSKSGEDGNNFPSVADYASRVQASRTELVGRLLLLEAFELDGKVRTPDKLLLAEHTKALLETIISQKWVTNGSTEQETSIEVDEALCLSTLQMSSFPADPVLLQCVLHGLGTRIEESKTDSENRQSHDRDDVACQLPSFTSPAKWCLDLSKVKVASARMLLQEEALKSSNSNGNTTTYAAGVPLADFLLEWPLRTPGMRLQDEVSEGDMALLRGLAVLADDNKLHYVPADAMQSMDAKARLASLFTVKTSYTVEELQPYLEGLWGPGAATAAKTIQELLSPLARFASATKTYSAK